MTRPEGRTDHAQPTLETPWMEVLLILNTVIGLFGVGDLILGADADPAIPLAVTGLTVEEIRATSEPRDVDAPLWSVAVAVSYPFIDFQPDVPRPPPAISGWVFFVLSAALLWASREAFHRPEDVDTRAFAWAQPEAGVRLSPPGSVGSPEMTTGVSRVLHPGRRL